MIEAVAIIVLALVCLGQAVERYFFAKSMLKQLDDAIKASMSRNINEYLTATTTPKSDTKPAEVDEVLLENADEETFKKFIKQQAS